MLRAILMLGIFSLGACHASGEAPPLASYSRMTQAQAAKELRALPKDSAVAKMIVDYSKLRRAAQVGKN